MRLCDEDSELSGPHRELVELQPAGAMFVAVLPVPQRQGIKTRLQFCTRCFGGDGHHCNK